MIHKYDYIIKYQALDPTRIGVLCCCFVYHAIFLTSGYGCMVVEEIWTYSIITSHWPFVVICAVWYAFPYIF